MKVNTNVFLVSLFLCFSFFSWAQEEKTLDSLLSVYKTQADDTLKLYILSFIYRDLINKDPEESIKYVRESKALSKKINDFKYLGIADHNEAIYHRNRGEKDMAEFFFKSAIKNFRKSKWVNGEIMSTSSLAIMAYNKGNYDEALSLMSKNEILRKSVKVDSSQIATALNIKSVIYLDQGNYFLGLKYALESAKVSEAIRDDKRLATLYSLIGEIEHLSGNYAKNLSYYKQAEEKLNETGMLRFSAVNLNYMAKTYIALDDFTNAKKVLEESLNIAKQINATREEGNSLATLGLIATKEGNFRQALEYLEQSKTINRKLEAAHSLAGNLIGSGIVYNEMGNPRKALLELNEALSISESINGIENIQSAYLNRSISYEYLKLPNKALSDFKKYKAFNDSIFKTERARKIEELRAVYDTEKKEQQIAQQEIEISLLEEKEKVSRLQKIALGGGLGLSLLALGFGFYGFRQRTKKNRLEKEKVEAELAFKKKELTTHALHLAKKNEVLEQVKQKAKELKSVENIEKGYQTLVQTINFDQQDDKAWENFTQYFEAVHKDFSKHSVERYPEISKNELRLMALLKMNMSSKEIASILNISADGVKKARQRLRKKMQLSPVDSLETTVMAI